MKVSMVDQFDSIVKHYADKLDTAQQAGQRIVVTFAPYQDGWTFTGIWVTNDGYSTCLTGSEMTPETEAMEI